MTETHDILERLAGHEEQHLETLLDYLRIPSVSTDPAYRDDVRRCAGFVRDQMIAAGLEARIIEASEAGVPEGHPLVYGEWMGAPGKPTLLFYGHYDVQPPDPLDAWDSPPFEPTITDGRIVARGATDDKGQSLTHVLAVGELLSARGELPVNVRFLVEGEEEAGGETIEAWVRGAGRDRLEADAVVVSDTSMLAPGWPSLIYGLKGMLYTQIDVRGPNRDLHSGSFGGAVQNPGNALATIVGALRDPHTGRVQIPGFYDDVLPLEDWEREGFSAIEFDEEAYCAEIGIPVATGERGYSTRERAWARPTCDVNGMWGGYSGEGAKTIIPASAGAKVSMRLVPGQDPEKIERLFRSYVEALTPDGVEVEVTALSAAEAVLVDVQGPIAEAALSALEDEWGRAPAKVREGGSIPIVGDFARELEAPVLLMGFGLSDDRLHAPNEKFEVAHFHAGIRTIARFIDRVGAL